MTISKDLRSGETMADMTNWTRTDSELERLEQALADAWWREESLERIQELERLIEAHTRTLHHSSGRDSR